MSTPGDNINLDQCIEQLKECHPLKENQIKVICNKVR